MLTKITCRAAVWALAAGLLPGQLLAQTNAPAIISNANANANANAVAPVAAGLAGFWQGPLSIPGGSLPIEISITPLGANKFAATLDLPTKRLSRVPATVVPRGDTVVFYAATVDCRFVCVPRADGQELRGIWSQPGLRVPLVLRHAATATSTASGAAKNVAAPVAISTYHTEAVTLTSQPGNVPLAGTLSIPDGPGPFPAAVLLSDMGSHDRDASQGQYRLFAGLQRPWPARALPCCASTTGAWASRAAMAAWPPPPTW